MNVSHDDFLAEIKRIARGEPGWSGALGEKILIPAPAKFTPLSVKRATHGTPFRCPNCRHSYSSITDSRKHKSGFSIRRRRCCPVCMYRWTTFECFDGPVTVAAIEKSAA